MERRAFGSTGLEVSALGYGAGQIGGPDFDEAEAGRLLNAVLDEGINLIDTARGYGLSEERIGRHLAHRRDEFVLSTKVGYDVPGLPNWTYDTIIAGVDQALRRLNTDVIDIVHLHSCPLETLQHAGVVDALHETVRQGKVRVAAYSGENEPLAWAIESGRFGSLQTSANVTDQRGINGLVPQARRNGMGVIAKRPVANAPWLHPQQPVGRYVEEYWLRWKQMDLQLDLPWPDVFLRFAVYHSGADTCIVGTSNLAHLRENIEIAARGPLPEAVVAEIRQAFQAHDQGWVGQV